MASLRNAQERLPIRHELLLVFTTLWVITFSKMFKGKCDIYTRVLTHLYEKKIYIYLVFAFSTNRIRYYVCLKLRHDLEWPRFLLLRKKIEQLAKWIFLKSFQSIFWKVCGPNLKGLPIVPYGFHFNSQCSLKCTFCCPRDFRIVVWSKNRFHVGANAHLPKILIQESL